MGAFGTIGGYYLLQLVSAALPKKPWRKPILFVVSWLTIVAASALVAVELWLSGQATLGAALVAMLGWYSVIGLIEGALTVATLTLLGTARPELLERHLWRQA